MASSRKWLATALPSGVAGLGAGLLLAYALGDRLGGQPAAALKSPAASPSASGIATPTPTATMAQPTPVGTPPASCWFGDFPYYPGSLAVAAGASDGNAWHVNAAPSFVAHYFQNGASQLAWTFQLTDASGGQWTFRMSRAPACWGTLNVLVDPAGGTLFEADPGA